MLTTGALPQFPHVVNRSPIKDQRGLATTDNSNIRGMNNCCLGLYLPGGHGAWVFVISFKLLFFYFKDLFYSFLIIYLYMDLCR